MEKSNKKRITNTGITKTGKSSLGSFPNFRSYTRKIVTKAKMREISKNVCMWERDNIFLENVGVSSGIRETWQSYLSL